MFLGSDAPVAEQYKTLALGRLACSSCTASPVREACIPACGIKFLLLSVSTQGPGEKGLPCHECAEMLVGRSHGIRQR